MSGFRLREGGVVDRGRPLRWRFDGRARAGLAGDTVGSAMLAAGLGTVARSFKYHRPRGVMTAGEEEPAALVTLGREARRTPNAKAPAVELVEGLEVSGQNAWPSVRFDLGQVNDLLGRYFAAGFYYKTFFGISGRGTWEWMRFERVIRAAAGLGRAADPFDVAKAGPKGTEAYDVVHDHCDIAVVGGGAAGIAAAEAAAAAGNDVVLIEQDFLLGGRLIGRADLTVDGENGAVWLEARRAALAAAGVRVLTRTTAFGLYDGNVLGLLQRAADANTPGRSAKRPEGAFRILRPSRVILATGAQERLFACAGNDRPGVMLAGAMERYASRWAVAPGSRAVIATASDGAHDAAQVLARAGVEVVLADARADTGTAGDASRAAGVTVLSGHVPVAVNGSRRVKSVWLGRSDGAADGIALANTDRLIKADCLGLSGGWSPAIHLVCHRGVKPVWDARLGAFRAGDEGRLPAGLSLAGACDGRGMLQAAVGDGRAAGEAAARDLGTRKRARRRPDEDAATASPLHAVQKPGAKAKAFLDPMHDVTTSDIRLAAREGYTSVEHMKRYTTLGMATDQGKTGGVAGLGVLAATLGQTIAETGITTFRPPYTPVPLAALAGRARGAHWQPTRLTPMHDVLAAAGARFTDAGHWKRCWYMPRALGGDGDPRRTRQAREDVGAAYIREAATVRRACGLCDVSTLGKIDVAGPDAATFLNRVYVNGFAKLPVGKARYGVMLRDDGIVLDDGVAWRLAEDRFWVTCTTAQAGRVMHWLEYLADIRWPELRVTLTSSTDRWAGMAIAGPCARAALQRLIVDGDVSNEGLPFMGVRDVTAAVEGGVVPVRLGRVSFSGELAFELHTPAGWGAALWQAAVTAVEAEGGCIYGLEALGALRIEKGHVTGAELDGRMTLGDAGLGRMASTKKDFVGKALMAREGLVEDGRPSLVHVVPVEREARFGGGAVLCDPKAPGGVGGRDGHGIGWITGVTWSDAFDCWLGIGFAEGGPSAWAGREITVREPAAPGNGGGSGPDTGPAVRARIKSAHRLDPEGARMHA
ncbi:MAG: 2Fe-2S iron-sulfur cluster-binding protein [Pseudomonadota bacterium]